MASDLRKQWQDMKKRYPDFEKARNYKANFGPQLDTLVKGMAELTADLKKVKTEADDIVTQLTSLIAVSQAHESIAATLEKQGGNNKGVLKCVENATASLEGGKKIMEGFIDPLKQVLSKAGV